MIRTAVVPLVIVLSAVFASSMVLALAAAPGVIGIALAGFFACWLIFALWPWAVLPAGILGGTVAAFLVGQTDVRGIVVMHLLPLAAGCFALVSRRLIGLDRLEPAPRFYRLSMIVLLATIAISAIYGLTLGNSAKDVLIATYQILIIPIYFLMTLNTLNTPQRLRNATIFYIGAISILTAMDFASPGRHGGLLSLGAIPPLIVFAGRAGGWARGGLAAVAAMLTADVVLASYRGLWIAAGIVAVVLLARGGPAVRRGLAVTALACAVPAAIITLGLSGEFSGRLSVVDDALTRSAGYRIPEASIGWHVFMSEPLLGAGLGQTSPRIYIPGFAVTNVGPVYHSFYIVLLANLGLVGFVAILLPIFRTIWTGATKGGSMSLALAAMTCGFLAAALVEGPTDGHWELGLIPALTLLTMPAGEMISRRDRRRSAQQKQHLKPVSAPGAPPTSASGHGSAGHGAAASDRGAPVPTAGAS